VGTKLTEATGVSREGVRSRANHKPEDLPGLLTSLFSWKGRGEGEGTGAILKVFATALRIFYFKGLEDRK
jgi:hypothetical protein